MRVIVSTTLQDKFSNFVIVDNFKKIRELKGVTLLVIHNFKESAFDVGVFISEFYSKGVKDFLYINEAPEASIRAVLVGVSGHVFEDEFYLDDEEELMALIDDLDMDKDETTDLAVASTNIVKDFIQGFARGEERVKAPLYLQQVEDALNELSTITQMQSVQLVDMGTSALQVFDKANTIITNMAKQKQILESQLKELESASVTQTSKPTFGGNILFFPSYKYVGSAKVLVIRELSPCRYLTSFILAYEHYLHYELNKRVKLVFVHQKGAGVANKYSEYTAITQESMGLESLYDSEIIATNNPKNDVMKRVFSKPADIFIIVDRLYGNQDIVVGRVSKLSAVSGKSDLARFNVKANNCIFSVTKEKESFITIPTVSNYPSGEDRRHAAYMQVGKDMFSKIDEYLQVLK